MIAPQLRIRSQVVTIAIYVVLVLGWAVLPELLESVWADALVWAAIALLMRRFNGSTEWKRDISQLPVVIIGWGIFVVVIGLLQGLDLDLESYGIELRLGSEPSSLVAALAFLVAFYYPVLFNVPAAFRDSIAIQFRDLQNAWPQLKQSLSALIGR